MEKDVLLVHLLGNDWLVCIWGGGLTICWLDCTQVLVNEAPHRKDLSCSVLAKNTLLWNILNMQLKSQEFYYIADVMFKNWKQMFSYPF